MSLDVRLKCKCLSRTLVADRFVLSPLSVLGRQSVVVTDEECVLSCMSTCGEVVAMLGQGRRCLFQRKSVLLQLAGVEMWRGRWGMRDIDVDDAGKGAFHGSLGVLGKFGKPAVESTGVLSDIRGAAHNTRSDQGRKNRA